MKSLVSLDEHSSSAVELFKGFTVYPIMGILLAIALAYIAPFLVSYGLWNVYADGRHLINGAKTRKWSLKGFDWKDALFISTAFWVVLLLIVKVIPWLNSFSN